MTTSLNDTIQIEARLTGTESPAQAALLNERLAQEPQLREKLYWQRCTYDVVKLYGRQQLKQEIEAVHRKLFSQPQHKTFRDRILRLFR